MIIEYHRPESLEEALQLLSREEITTVPMGGGSALNQPSGDQVAAVDLQALGLNTFQVRGNFLELGATLTLEEILAIPDLPPGMPEVIKLEATYNLRQVATLAGTLLAADGRSPLATLCLALDAQLMVMPGAEIFALGDVLPVRRERMRSRLVTQVMIPLQVKLAYEYVARTPADLAIVCLATVQWPSGRTRLAAGGYGRVPRLVFDGPQAEGISPAVENAYRQSGDEWASAEYRRAVAVKLAARSLEKISHSS
jgi:CO/xanthine dehydrogenase FAD-binding subunit